MPDPSWSAQYDMANTPEGNGFTRIIYGNPLLTLVRGGSPSQRRIELDTTNGDMVFQTTTVPSLARTQGVSVEWRVAVTAGSRNVSPGPNFGVEITFLDRVFACQIFPDKVWVFVPMPGDEQILEVATGANAVQTRWRMTYDGAQIRVYRDAALVVGPFAPGAASYPFQRVLWWAENGALCTVTEMKYWLGGAMAPG